MIKVLVGGCFDVLHYGHVRFLKQAKALGDHLVVLLESDARIKKLKGPNRPIHNQVQRKEIIESLRFVDEVILTKDEMADKDYMDLVININPQIIAITKGSGTKTHADLISAKVVELDQVDNLSTTKLLNLTKGI